MMDDYTKTDNYFQRLMDNQDRRNLGAMYDVQQAIYEAQRERTALIVALRDAVAVMRAMGTSTPQTRFVEAVLIAATSSEVILSTPLERQTAMIYAEARAAKGV
jgi:hypothetical protein